MNVKNLIAIFFITVVTFTSCTNESNEFVSQTDTSQEVSNDKMSWFKGKYILPNGRKANFKQIAKTGAYGRVYLSGHGYQAAVWKNYYVFGWFWNKQVSIQGVGSFEIQNLTWDNN